MLVCFPFPFPSTSLPLPFTLLSFSPSPCPSYLLFLSLISRSVSFSAFDFLLEFYFSLVCFEIFPTIGRFTLHSPPAYLPVPYSLSLFPFEFSQIPFPEPTIRRVAFL